MSKVVLQQIQDLEPYQYSKGYVTTNSFRVNASSYGIFSIGGGYYDGGFANLSNVTNPLYQSIITQKCTLRNQTIGMARAGTVNTQTGFGQTYTIYLNGISYYSTTLAGNSTTLFTLLDIDVPLEVGDKIGFSLDNTMNSFAAGTYISINTFFEFITYA